MNETLRKLEAALRAAGAEPHEAHAIATFGERELEPWLHDIAATLDSASDVELWHDLVDGLLHGPPRGRTREAWEALYRAGCPLERIGLIVQQSFVDPKSCGWDIVLHESNEAALAEVRRYIALEFPFRRGPWVELGAEAALEAARVYAGLVRDQKAPHNLAQIAPLRRACVTILGELDSASMSLTETLTAEHTLEELEVDLVGFVEALSARIGRGAVVVDRASDSYVDAALERPAWPPAPRPRAPAPSDAGRARRVTAAYLEHRARSAPEDHTPSFDEAYERKLVYSPLEWLSLW